MAYNDRRYNDRGGYNGYNSRGQGYNDRDRGYNDRSYDRPFNIGDPVKHRATGTILYVISFGREQIECRKPDLSAEYFYEHELAPVSPEELNNMYNK